MNGIPAKAPGTEAGGRRMESRCGEILKLHDMLTKAGIPHAFEPHPVGGYQIAYYGHEARPEPEPGHEIGLGWGSVCSAVETPTSYGNEKDLIEISGLLNDEEAESDGVAGYLAADDVFARILAHWKGEST